MLNLTKITEAASAELALEKKKAEMLEAKIHEYFTLLNTNIETAAPHEILEILSVLISFRDCFISESKWEDLVICSIKKIRQAIYDSAFHGFYAYGGIAEIAFIIHNLCQMNLNLSRFLNNLNQLLTDNILNYIKSSEEPDFLLINNTELIQGLSGTLRYMLDFLYNDILNHAATKTVEVLIKRSQPKTLQGQRLPGWHYYPSEIERRYMQAHELSENGVAVNYGVSHGIGGPLVALAMAYKNGINAVGLKEAINGIFTEYMKGSYYVNGIINWPGRITFEQYVGQEEISKQHYRMSWCYGSIGILRSMYLASVYTKNKETENFALIELEKIAQMEDRDYLLSSPIVCHGYAGTVSIMSEMYKETGNVLFLDSARRQVKLCVEHIIHADFAYKNPDPHQQVYLYSYLEGYSSIFQTILSFLDIGDNMHKKRLLVL